MATLSRSRVESERGRALGSRRRGGAGAKRSGTADPDGTAAEDASPPQTRPTSKSLGSAGAYTYTPPLFVPSRSGSGTTADGASGDSARNSTLSTVSTLTMESYDEASGFFDTPLGSPLAGSSSMVSLHSAAEGGRLSGGSGDRSSNSSGHGSHAVRAEMHERTIGRHGRRVRGATDSATSPLGRTCAVCCCVLCVLCDVCCGVLCAFNEMVMYLWR